MTFVGWSQIAIVLALTLIAAIPLSGLIVKIYAGEANVLTPVMRPVERLFYRLAGVDETREQSWLAYAMAMIAFSIVGFLSLYALQRLQGVLPLNPQQFPGVPADLAFNTSISFITNTNWQNYAGEQTMSHLTQMLGLTVHNFLSAATGLAMAFALVRAFARSSATDGRQFLGRYDPRRSLRPAAAVDRHRAGPRRARRAADARRLGRRRRRSKAPSRRSRSGPMASQEAIKELGTNGGGFLNANSAHPFENPNAWTNMLEIWSLLLVPVASVIAFGRAVGDFRQGRAILAAMGILLVVGVGVVYWAESAGNPILTALGVDPAGGNLEGKEVRFGQAMSALFATATTGTSTGAVNAMHDSLTPLGGLVPMFNLLAGCIWPGGVGAGLYGFLVLAVIAVFIAGLMVGRTPEYLGKKIEAREMKLAMFAVLIYPLAVLGFSAAVGDAADRARQHEQHRPAWPVRDPLRLRLGQRQQRLGFRRPQRRHAVVQHDARHRHAGRPLRLCDPGAGARRRPRRQEEGAAVGRHVPDHRSRCSSAC